MTPSEEVQAADSHSGREMTIFDWHLGKPERRKLAIGGKAVCTAFPRLKLVLSTDAGILAVGTEQMLDRRNRKSESGRA